MESKRLVNGLTTHRATDQPDVSVPGQVFSGALTFYSVLRIESMTDSMETGRPRLFHA